MANNQTHEEGVKHYYDNNTSLFLQLGQSGRTGNIHQALWPKGVKGRFEALQYTNRMVLDRLEQMPFGSGKILDLGCGVGGSLVYLAQNCSRDFYFTGVTISSRQQQIAGKWIDQLGLGARCRVLEASFQDLPASIGKVQFAFAIGAFVHSPDIEEFLQQVSTTLERRGRLILIDDFPTPSGKADPKAEAMIERFKRGWKLGTLLPVDEMARLAAVRSLELLENTDLTPYIKLNRSRDFLLALAVRLFGNWMSRSLYFLSLLGGDARRTCLKKGWIRYRLLMFEKRNE